MDDQELSGHVIACDGIQPSPDKIMAIKNISIPTTVKDIQSFLSLEYDFMVLHCPSHVHNNTVRLSHLATSQAVDLQDKLLVGHLKAHDLSPTFSI
ncbi:hypothetical protein BJ085DRAFT_40043 [Dimargaris cristalligena]|uniref:Uncharacterized protein n=1 Tax=Dimargaris cristalligena TaxID=215637 RepID=A0A4P9ZJ03_9FUNG|nr:hypothetical protein BJ085DRAFT_40043 [Dimargaris cristalligena]|eukprot:RKP33177.1 hypothetical protein BJ085DRAFT_40043 [Dimargaris cristalligena]